ncbi:hypothetical protein B0T14DRAFT_517624 [Immersiella caudata]|uniref:Uncharacterized protein n=1 Tax=Immersiella caudata TaxID=314043 RepID=A0AA39WYV6_9PEZI|nr:hypothetical protein B0T14DRAFT_517624 [Immersiella caudata]
MDHIPGSYPADTPVATPQATPQQEPNMIAQPPSHGIFGYHEHPERNTLHKPEDPRGHKQADSGVSLGTLSSEPTQSSKVKEPRTVPMLETMGGDTYATEGSLSSGKLGDEPRRSDSPPTQRDSTYTFAPTYGDAASDELEEKHTKASKESTPRGPADNSPPYWGNLPKAARGGVYNTVTGHGSPKDDHAQHHSLPQRGGVYNTVAGHGSQDEESKRHAQDAYVAVPLPEIKEDKPLQLDETAPRSASTHGGFLPVTADTRESSLAGAFKETNEFGAPEQPSRTASAAETGPRAFPLVAGHDRLGSRSSANPEANQEVPEAESRTRDSSLLAGAAAGAGAGLLASEVEKPRKLQKRQGSPNEGTRGRHDDERPKDNVIGGSLPHRPKDRSKSRSKSKSKSDESSPNARKHSILGIFHRRKDSKGEVEEPKKEEPSHHPSYREVSPGAAAAAAGTSALLHHKNKGVKDNRSTSEPMASQPHHDQPRKHMSVNESAAAAVAESAGAFGILYQKPTNGEAREPASERTSASTAPSVPSKSEKRRSYSPRASAALADEMQVQAPGWESSSQVSPSDSRTQSSDASKYAAAGAAGATAGLGASLFAHDHRHASESSTGAPVFEHPREPPSTPFNASQAASSKTDRGSPSPKTTLKVLTRHSEEVTVKPGDYNTLASGTASGVKPRASSHSAGARRQVGSNAGEEYNVLRSGTTSGVQSGVMSSQLASKDPRGVASEADEEYNHPGSSTALGVRTGSASVPSQDQTGRDADASPDTRELGDEKYNVLPSGTPSGVKIKPMSQHASFTEGSDDHRVSRTGDGQYNTLASGTPSSVGAARQQSDAPENEAQSARHALVAAPVPMPSLGDGSPKVVPHEQAEKAYPSPSQAQEMSPAVLPGSYKEHSHSVPAAKEPEVGTSKTSTSSSNYSQPEYTTHSTDPALAAANGAWAAKAGASSGVPDRAKILHKCEHCGKDNDISPQFTRDNIAKVNNKTGSTGNWWQNAWTSA